MESSLNSPKYPANHRGSLSPWSVIGILLVILGLSAMVRFSLFHEVYDEHPERIISPDTVRYEQPAVSLLVEGTMRDGLPLNESQDLHVAPGYPWFIYSVYKLFGQDHKYLVYAQIALSLVNIFLIYLFAVAVWNSRAALAATALFAAAPLQSLYSSILLSETLFVFSVLLVCNFAVRFLKRYSTSPSLWLALLLGVAIGFSALVRPISYYLVFVFLFALFVFNFFVSGRTASRYFSCAACIVIGFAILVGPWQIRNKSIAGEYLFTDNPGQIMLYWKAAGLIAYRDGIEPKEVREQLRSTVPTDFSSIAEKHAYEKNAGLEIIKADIPSYIRFSFHGLRTMVVGPGLKKFGNFFDGENAGRVVETTNANLVSGLEVRTGFQAWYLLLIAYSVFYLLFVYLLFLYGTATYWRRGEHRIVLVFCIALAGYFILASTGHSAADSRMRIPAMPMLVLFAGIGLSTLMGSKWLPGTKQAEKKVEKAEAPRG